jgi:hypothetical protein
MGRRWIRRALLATTLTGVVLVTLTVAPAQAQWWPSRCPPLRDCPPPPCALPAVPPPQQQLAPQPQPAEQPAPGREQPAPGREQPAAPTEPSFGGEQAAAGEQVASAIAAPAMLGDLLGGSRSTTFFYQRSRGSVFINGTGSTSLFNAKVADDNSPLPQDRVYFRYNFFSDSQKVTGDSGKVVFDPTLGLSQFSQPRFRGITTTKSYDVNDFTFAGEKTFWNGLASVELRVPFRNAVSNNLDLSVAKITSVGRDNDGDSNSSVLQTTPTPQNSFGTTDTEFGDMTLILKGLFYRSCTLAVSGGLSVNIPTAPSTHVSVTDFLGDGFDNDIEIERLRQFKISNDTWALSPFVAALLTPNDRLFVQGFLQFDFPLNESTVHYAEFAAINTEPNELSLQPLFVTSKVREQTLMQVDLGTGYWLQRDRNASWITGIAPTLELHYTTTLQNADIKVLPTATKSASLNVVGTNGQLVPEPNPTVGNLRNRVDILDLTVGTTFLVAERATIATGFVFPLRNGDDRTFNWEFQLQLNYYFGGPRGPRWAPPSL